MQFQTIWLVRHGPSELNPRGLLGAQEWLQYLETYDAHGLVSGAAASPAMIDVAAKADAVVSSPMRRAAETLDLVRPAASGAVIQVWPQLAEVPQPAPRWSPFPLPLDAWDVLTRVMWLCGDKRSAEGRREAVERADRTAHDLEELFGKGVARECVVVIAHGFFNALLARALRQRGWRGPWWPDHRHGKTTAYTRSAGLAKDRA